MIQIENSQKKGHNKAENGEQEGKNVHCYGRKEHSKSVIKNAEISVLFSS